MYSRILETYEKNVLILGPRGVGKSSWLKNHFKEALFFDLLHSDTFLKLQASPSNLARLIPHTYKGAIVIDEIQKIPLLLDEVHRLIESRDGLYFILTGSSARTLRKQGVNLLAGRTLSKSFFPLTALELGDDFDLKKSLQFGHLPMSYTSNNPKEYLSSYVMTYLKEEIKEESLTRNLSDFTRFLEAASFSQGSPLNYAETARECGVSMKVVKAYFDILRDTLVSFELPIFTKKAKRALISKNKFYFFDVGVFQTLRPKGPLDDTSSINGIALESLVIQELIALINYKSLNLSPYYWHTKDHKEVDLILYGEAGFMAIEIKSSIKVRDEDLKALKLFKNDYPMAELKLIYGGDESFTIDDIDCLPIKESLLNLL